MIDYDIIYESYLRNNGNKTAVANELGIHRDTVRKYLGEEKPLFGGQIEYLPENIKELPEPGQIKRYILTCAQNNTKVFSAFWKNLVFYAQHLGAELMVSRFTYDKSSYSTNPKSVKPGTHDMGDEEELWYDNNITPFICDDRARHGSCRWRLAPDLLWCAEMNILPTAVRPLSGLESYTGLDSGIFPHVKIALQSIASNKHEPTKIIYTTGTVTQRNYIQKKEGLKGQFHHVYGALLVEVDSEGNWWARHLNADSSGSFYDLTTKVSRGQAIASQRVEAITWGDTHASDITEEVLEANWGNDGLINFLKPKYQFQHDIFSMRSRSHHEMKSLDKMYQKFVKGEESVENEVYYTAALMRKAHRDFCQQVIVCSNHDRHGERWLDETDYRKDLLNAEFFLEAQLSRIRAIKKREDWSFLEWACRRAGCPAVVKFLGRDESFKICGGAGRSIECGLHGDEGPDGARGTTQNLSKTGCRMNKGHSHVAMIHDGVYSAGTCSLEQGYNHGPSSWSISHIVSYANGKRAILTMRAGKYFA